MLKLQEWKDYHKRIIKGIDGFLFLFSVLFAMMLEISRHIFYHDGDVSNVETTYITDFHLLDGIFLALLVPLVYLVTKGILKIFGQLRENFFGEKRSGKRHGLLFAGCMTVFMILWTPYLMSYWPGGIFSDTVDSIQMALGKAQIDSHNPVLYTMIWRGMFQVTGAFAGKGEYGGLKLFTVVQMVLIAATLSFFLTWCYQKGIHKKWIILCFLTFAVVPLYPFYGVALWKDTLFCLVVFMYSLFLYELMERKQKSTCEAKTVDFSLKQLICYSILSLLVIFLRNNGIYIFVLTAFVFLLITVFHKWKKMAVKLSVISLILLIFSMIIQGPVFDSKGYNIDRGTESLGIPMQQMAYIVSTNGKVEVEDLEMMGQLMPIESWKALYNPTVADSLKFDPCFQKEYLEKHQKEFLETYLHMVKNNKVKAIKAYLLATIGFWDIFEGSANAYVVTEHFGNVEYFISDYFDYYTDISFKKLVEPKSYISSAIWVWIMLFTLFVCLSRKDAKGILAIVPTFAVWATIMIATPIAFSLRYVYSLFLCVPLYLVILFHETDNDKENNH